jgi:formylglycine-generating enzyme required for sulfatase activity
VAALLATAAWFATRERDGGSGDAGGPAVDLAALPPAPAWARVSAAQRVAAHGVGLPVAFEHPLGMRFVFVPAGRFRMGSPPEQAGRAADEVAHPVTLTRGWYAQTTEVTNASFRRFRPDHRTPAVAGHGMDADEQPAANLTWEDAMAFARWVGEQPAGAAPPCVYDLPTEAEWERQARAGTDGAWWWGDDPGDLPRHANFGDRRARDALGLALAHPLLDDGFVVTAPVGRYAPNPWGLHDLLGNVWEWCRTPHDNGVPYAEADAVDPQGDPAGRGKALRGGAFRHDPRLVRCAARFAADPYAASDDFGLRLVARPR